MMNNEYNFEMDAKKFINWFNENLNEPTLKYEEDNGEESYLLYSSEFRDGVTQFSNSPINIIDELENEPVYMITTMYVGDENLLSLIYYKYKLIMIKLTIPKNESSQKKWSFIPINNNYISCVIQDIDSPILYLEPELQKDYNKYIKEVEKYVEKEDNDKIEEYSKNDIIFTADDINDMENDWI